MPQRLTVAKAAIVKLLLSEVNLKLKQKLVGDVISVEIIFPDLR